MTLPDIIESALEAVEQFAAICESLLGLVADGHICPIAIRNGQFVYAATEAGASSGDSSPSAG